MLLLALFLLLSIVLVQGEWSDFYREYPDNIIPNVQRLRRYANEDRYELLAYEPSIYVSNASSRTAENILETYRFIEEYQGFIFFPNGTLSKVLMRKKGTSTTFSGYVGEMMASTDGELYYEKIPMKRKSWLISKLYGDETTYRNTRINMTSFIPSKHCILRGNLATVSTCNQIPKCLGFFVEDSATDSPCLLSFLSKNILTSEGYSWDGTTEQVGIKRSQKTLLTLMQENRQTTIILLLLLWDIELIAFNTQLFSKTAAGIGTLIRWIIIRVFNRT